MAPNSASGVAPRRQDRPRGTPGSRPHRRCTSPYFISPFSLAAVIKYYEPAARSAAAVIALPRLMAPRGVRSSSRPTLVASCFPMFACFMSTLCPQNLPPVCTSSILSSEQIRASARPRAPAHVRPPVRRARRRGHRARSVPKLPAHNTGGRLRHATAFPTHAHSSCPTTLAAQTRTTALHGATHLQPSTEPKRGPHRAEAELGLHLQKPHVRRAARRIKNTRRRKRGRSRERSEEERRHG